MNKLILSKWHSYLRIDFIHLVQDLPTQMRQVLLKKAASLIADDWSGYKLCLAAIVGDSGQLIAVTELTLRQLHLIYLCSWISYTIYDDINDGETKANLLPVANYLLLMTLELSRSLGVDRDYQQLLLAHFKAMELANYLELHLDKLASYPEDLLFQRASGQLFALQVLSAKWQLSSNKSQHLLMLMRLLLTILQIQDDLRDYLSDYLSGKITFVNQSLFCQSFIDKLGIRNYFYQKILPEILDNLTLRLHEARYLLSQLPEFNVQSGFFNFILTSREKILVNDKSKNSSFNKLYRKSNLAEIAGK